MNDQVLKERIIGTWTATQIEDGIKYQGRETYFKEGTMTAEFDIFGFFGHEQVKVEGAWNIKNGTLFIRVLRCNHPSVPATEKNLESKIVFLDNQIYQCVSGRGKTTTYKRYKI